jgi:hypothetical protein
MKVWILLFQGQGEAVSPSIRVSPDYLAHSNVESITPGECSPKISPRFRNPAGCVADGALTSAAKTSLKRSSKQL